MKVIVEIPNNEATFGMKVLKSLSFVKKANPNQLSLSVLSTTSGFSKTSLSTAGKLLRLLITA